MLNFKEITSVLPKQSTLKNYLEWIENNNSYNKKYEILSNSFPTDDSIFLSIVIRTQGKRPESLREVLLNLDGQTCDNFEVILIGHKLNKSQELLVNNIISEQQISLREKIRFYKVDDGTRTTPLNYGFAYSKGKYISILDDDDVIFDNWVEEFFKASIENEGRMLHSYCYSQDWTSNCNENYNNCLRSEHKPSAVFCKDYDFIEEYKLNVCPPVSLAFPSYCFKELCMYFDESLNTTEDWDYILRIANVAGYFNIETPTCIYRNWINSENSHTLHNEEEWKKNYYLIIDKLKQTPKLFDSSYKFDSSHKFDLVNKSDEIIQNDKFFSVKLYADLGSGFSENYSTESISQVDNGCFDVIFSGSLFESNNVKRIRIDPTEDGLVTVKNISCRVLYEDLTESTFGIKDCSHNGLKIYDSIFFPLTDPNLIFKVNRKKIISKVIFKCSLDYENDRESIILKLSKHK